MINRACISLSNRCNLRCRYCHFQDKQNDLNRFDNDTLLSVIDNIHTYCTDNSLDSFKLGIVGSGEPFIEEDLFFSLLDHIIKSSMNEFRLYTITNGTLMTEELASRLYEYKDYLRVCISLDGYEELHNTGRSDFAKVMDAISIYKKVFGKNPPINATVNKLSYTNINKVISFFLENDLHDVTFSMLFACDDPELKITKEEFDDFMAYARSSGLMSRQFTNKISYDCAMYGKLCGVGRTNIFITPEGIYPCGRFYKNDHYLLGDATTPIYQVEEKNHSIKPTDNGNCYYDCNVEKIK